MYGIDNDTSLPYNLRGIPPVYVQKLVLRSGQVVSNA